MPDEITLTHEQGEAVRFIMQWMQDPLIPEFRLGGYAGTGKTTLIKFLLATLAKEKKTVFVAAFTGKAVSVLARKGVYGSTLHALMYEVEELKGGGVVFNLKPFLVGNPDLIIVDEASMISTELYEHLQSFNTKMLFIGDPGQLEPVGDNPNLMSRTDFVLTTIHRQAELSPIIGLATQVRKNGVIMVTSQAPQLIVRPKSITSPEFLSADQVICARNNTRVQFNDRIRQFKKLPVGKVVVGEKLICLRNNSKFFVFNGQILFVEKLGHFNGETQEVTCKDELGKSYVFPLWMHPFHSKLEEGFQVPRYCVWCDYGYAITCHKSQGSEWNKVIVWDEVIPRWDMKRWRYTAITRAAQELIYNI